MSKNNLYRIIVGHFAPKDSLHATWAFLIAENEDQVYDWIANEPMIYEEPTCSMWKDNEETFEVYDDDYNVIGSETFREKIIRLKGEINDDDYDFSDSYYGITLYGWELIKEDFVITDSSLKELGILYTIN